MSLPLGNCPDCGGDQPFEQIHAAAGECPDTEFPGTPGGDCPEWACPACGAAVIMGTVPAHASAANNADNNAANSAAAGAAGSRRPVRAA